MIIPSNDPKQINMLYKLNDELDTLWQNSNQVTPQMNINDIERAQVRFYPSVIVNCKYEDVLHNGRNVDGTAPVPRSFESHTPTHPRLRKETKRLFLAVSKIFLRHRFYCATCAEDDAANKVLEELDKVNIQPANLSDLQFTKAIRPRTRQGIDYCVICEKIFG